MSVRKWERGEQKLEVLNYVTKLCSYSLLITSNEKHFPKKYRWTMANRILDEAFAVYTCIEEANDARLDTMADFRLHKQREAQAHIAALQSLIRIAYEAFRFEENTAEYWVDMAYDCHERLLKWMASDRNRVQ